MNRDTKGRFIKGMMFTEEDKLKLRLARSKIDQSGSKNHMWKGGDVGYKGLHKWIRSNLPKPNLCQICNMKPPFDVANKGMYDRDFNNWQWLCRKCHQVSDGRINNLIQYSGNSEERSRAAYKQLETKRK